MTTSPRIFGLDCEAPICLSTDYFPATEGVLEHFLHVKKCTKHGMSIDVA